MKPIFEFPNPQWEKSPKPLTFLSLFSGIGGFDRGFELSGMRCVGQVEADKDCRRTLKHHWPKVPIFEDVKKFKASDIETRPDIVCGGFPCQDLSVAGRKTGLKGARSGLWWEMLRVIDETKPKFVVWENVPGLLSSNKGRDMYAVVLSLVEHGFHGGARVLDSQHFGVAQRRKRLYGVFARGRFATERCKQILSVAEGRRRHSAKGEKAGQEVAGPLGAGTAKSGQVSDTERMTFMPYGLSFDNVKGNDGLGVVRNQSQTVGRSGNLGVAVGSFDPMQVTAKTNRTKFVLGGVCQTLHASGAMSIAATLTGRGKSGKGVNPPGRGGEDDSNLVVRNGDPGTFQFGAMVRRLTPTECLRLQSFSDDWLDLDPELSDSVKYRLVGNACTVNVCRWLGERLVKFGGRAK